MICDESQVFGAFVWIPELFWLGKGVWLVGDLLQESIRNTRREIDCLLHYLTHLKGSVLCLLVSTL
jgi:hypothetical protein